MQLRQCKGWEYVAKRKNYLKKLSESKHWSPLYPCNVCEFKENTNNSLSVTTTEFMNKFNGLAVSASISHHYHNQALHSETKFPCSSCSFLANSQGALNCHNFSTHRILKTQVRLRESFDSTKCPYKTKFVV